MSGRGQGSVTRNEGNKTAGGPPFVPTSADNGLSVSAGGIIQLGHINILSALTNFTANRFINSNGFNLQFSSSNIATPANRVIIGAAANISLTKDLAGGTNPMVLLQESVVGTTSNLFLRADAFSLIGSAGRVESFFIGNSGFAGTSVSANHRFLNVIGIAGANNNAVINILGPNSNLNIQGAAAADPSITMTNTGVVGASFIANHRSLVITGIAGAGNTSLLALTGPSSAVTVTGTAGADSSIVVNRAGGANFVTIQDDFVTVTAGVPTGNSAFNVNATITTPFLASQFRNLSAAAGATIKSIWVVDSLADFVGITRFSNANATYPGGGLIENLSATVAGSKLVLRSNSTAGAAFIINEIQSLEVGRYTATGLFIRLPAPSGNTSLGATNMPAFANNAAAVAGGLVVGEFYRLSAAGTSAVMVVE